MLAVSVSANAVFALAVALIRTFDVCPMAGATMLYATDVDAPAASVTYVNDGLIWQPEEPTHASVYVAVAFPVVVSVSHCERELPALAEKLDAFGDRVGCAYAPTAGTKPVSAAMTWAPDTSCAASRTVAPGAPGPPGPEAPVNRT
jgi:hypothetical protein